MNLRAANALAGVRCRQAVLARIVAWSVLGILGPVVHAGDAPGGVPPNPGQAKAGKLVAGRRIGVLSKARASGGVFAIDTRGDLLATKTAASIAIRDAKLGRIRSTLSVANATALEFSADSRLLAVASDVGGIAVFNWSTRESLASHSGGLSVDLLRFSANGRLLAVTSRHGDLEILEVDTANVKWRWTLVDSADALAWLGDSQIVILARGRISILEVGKTAAETIDTGTDIPSAITVGPTRKWIAWGCRNGTVALKPLPTGLTRRLRAPSASGVYSMVVVDETEVWIATDDGVEVVQVAGGPGRRVEGLDGQSYLSGGKDIVGAFSFSDETVRLLHPSESKIASGTAFEWSGRSVLGIGVRSGRGITSLHGGRVEHWSIFDNQMQSIDLPYSLGYTTLASDGAVAATYFGDELRVWDTSNARMLASAVCGAGTRAIRFSADNQRLFVWLPFSGLGVWDWRGSELKVFFASKSIIADVSQSADGSKIMVGYMNGDLKCLDHLGGVQNRTSVGSEIICLEVAGDGSAIVGCRNGDLVRWSGTDGAALVRVRSHAQGVRRIVIDAKGRWIASIGGDHRLRISDPTTLALGDVTASDESAISLGCDTNSVWVGSAEGVAREYVIGE